MPCTPEAVDVLRKANILIAPAMAAGAGGVRFQFFQFMHNRYPFLPFARTILDEIYLRTHIYVLIIVLSFNSILI